MSDLSDRDRNALKALTTKKVAPEKKKPAKRERMPVRVCSLECPHRQGDGDGCYDFQYGKAAHGLPCVPDLRKLERWRKAYEEGDDEIVKKDAGGIMGAMVIRAEQMLEQIDREGFVMKTPRVDARGEPVAYVNDDGQMTYAFDWKPHPLFDPLNRIVKMLGINLNEFGLTPKSSSDKGLGFSGNLTNIENLDVKVIVGGLEDATEDFAKTIALAKKMREADPVYKQFAPKKGDS